MVDTHPPDDLAEWVRELARAGTHVDVFVPIVHCDRFGPVIRVSTPTGFREDKLPPGVSVADAWSFAPTFASWGDS